jgi:hypothetical protein
MNAFVNSTIGNNSLAMALALAFLLAAILFLSFFNFWEMRKIKKKNKILFSGDKVKNLESLLLKQTKEIGDIDKEIQELFEISNRVHQLAQRGLHNIGVIRFNPFKDIGGDQSFAIALLDGKKSGLVISSLHTREGNRIYAKPVAKGEADKYPLTEEEKQAIKVASPVREGKV